MVVYVVADMEGNMVADMEVDMVAVCGVCVCVCVQRPPNCIT